MDKTPIKSFGDPSWTDLVSRFEKRVDSDNQELKAKLNKPLVYMSNPEICCNPKYLLLGMEPSNPREGAETVSFFPIFIHYCAYKYLCGEKFDYYITDLAKRRAADKEKQEERYSKWLPLFEEEWCLLGKPKIIVMSREVYKKIKYGFKDEKGKSHKFSNAEYICDYVYHYSSRYPKYLTGEYNEYSSKLATYKLDEGELEKFAKKLEEHLGPKPEISSDYYKNNIKETLEDEHHRKTVFPVYRYDFEHVAKGERIPHNNIDYAFGV